MQQVLRGSWLASNACAMQLPPGSVQRRRGRRRRRRSRRSASRARRSGAATPASLHRWRQQCRHPLQMPSPPSSPSACSPPQPPSALPACWSSTLPAGCPKRVFGSQPSPGLHICWDRHNSSRLGRHCIRRSTLCRHLRGFLARSRRIRLLHCHLPHSLHRPCCRGSAPARRRLQEGEGATAQGAAEAA
jgi:hypothetical protein